MRITVPGLQPNGAYALQFRSKSIDETSTWSRTFMVNLAGDTIAPKTPTGLNVVVSGESFVATWNPVVLNADDSLITDFSHYKISIRNVDNGDTVVLETTDTRYELTYNLNIALFDPVAATIGVKVAAVDESGNESPYTTEIIRQNPPPGPVRNLVATGIVDGISSTWDQPENLEGDFLEYRLFVSDNSGATFTNQSVPAWRGQATSVVYSTLSSIPLYIYVAAVDKFNSMSTVSMVGPVSVKSGNEVDIDPPGVPTGLAASISGNTLTATWDGSVDPDLAGYQISYRRVGDADWNFTNAPYEDDTIAISPVDQFVDYQVRIRAHDSYFNYSAWSSTATATGATNTAPDTPTGVMVKGAITSAIVTWTKNEDIDLDYYEVQFEDHTPTGADDIYNTTANIMGFSEDVVTNTTYYARVRAVDTGGLRSAWSSIASGTVGFIDLEPIEDALAEAITDYTVEYAVNSSETVPPSSGWSTSTPTRTPGTFIWYRAVITYGDESTNTTSPALLTGNTGAPGTPGDDAATINLTATSQVLVKPADSATTAPATAVVTGTAVNTTISSWQYSVDGGSFSSTVPAGVSRTSNVVTITGSTMTAKTIAVRMSDSSGVADTLTVARVFDGADGDDGDTGTPGEPGENAITVLLTNESHSFPGSTTAALAGNTVSSVLAYKGTTQQSVTIGTITGQVTGLTTSIQNNSSTTAQFTVTVTTSLTATGGVLTIPLTIDGKSFTKKFSWSVSHEGSQGIPGEPGDDGATLYTWLKYADTPTTGMSDSPAGKAYMGLAYNKTSASESSNYGDYQWSLIKGEDGADGIPGPPGDDGVTTYTWVKYSNSSNGSPMQDSPVGMKYIGLAFNKTVSTESNTPSDYAWSLIQGDDGSDGVGITSITPYFRTVTSGAAAPAIPTTNPPTGWTTTEPGYSDNTDLYRTERIIYTDSSFAYTAVTKVSAYTAASQAMASANGKNTIWRGSTTPTPPHKINDTWFKTNEGNAIYTWDGDSWEPGLIGTDAIANLAITNAKIGNLDAGKITTGELSANRIKTAEIAADAAFINALTVTDANIANVAADKLTAGSGIINDLTIKSNLTMGDVSNDGVIKSYNYVAGTSGYRMTKNSLEINDGSISASSLRLQVGQNLVAPQYADFEFSQDYYQSGGVAKTFTFNVNTTTNAKFGKQGLAFRKTGTPSTEVYFGTSYTDYNIPVESGKSYIVSVYAAGGPVTSDLRMRVKWSSGSFSTLVNKSIAAGSPYTRYSIVVTVPAGVTAMVPTFSCATSVSNAGWDLDGLQVEEKVGALDEPSPWSAPGVTAIDGSMIRTGSIRSNATVVVSGYQQPAWSIDIDGGMQIGSATVRGSIVVGSSLDGTQTSIQSHNYTPPAGGSSGTGWMIRSDGFADFTNIRIGPNSVSKEAIQANAISADMISSGVLQADIQISTEGELIVGQDNDWKINVTDGSIRVFAPPRNEDGTTPAPEVISIGKNAEGNYWQNLDSTGGVLSAIRSDGSATFTDLTVNELYVGDEGSIVDLIKNTTPDLVVMESGVQTSTHGSFTAKTGIWKWNMPAKAGHRYLIEAYGNITITNGIDNGYFFMGLNKRHATPPSTAPQPTLSTSYAFQEERTVMHHGNKRYFDMSWTFQPSNDEDTAWLWWFAPSSSARPISIIYYNIKVTHLGMGPSNTGEQTTAGGGSAPWRQSTKTMYFEKHRTWSQFGRNTSYSPSLVRTGYGGSSLYRGYLQLSSADRATIMATRSDATTSINLTMTHAQGWSGSPVISTHTSSNVDGASEPSFANSQTHPSTFNSGSTRTMTLTSAQVSALRAGAWGIRVGPASGNPNIDFYGTGNPSGSPSSKYPYLKVTGEWRD